MADAQLRCTQAAVLDQKLAGLDVITGGWTYGQAVSWLRPVSSSMVA